MKENSILNFRLNTVERERNAYKKAKEENDERFQLEIGELKTERDELLEQVEDLNRAFLISYQVAGDANSVKQERDEYREQLKKLEPTYTKGSDSEWGRLLIDVDDILAKYPKEEK